MATNKIYFNSTTNLVTLSGVYYNGTKIEGCKGIKLNGNIVVSFDTVSHELKWSDYTDAYNTAWTASDPAARTSKMAQMTAENEFAVVRSRWMLYNRIGLFDSVGITSDYKLFNFNSDGKIYVKDDNLVANWETLQDNRVSVITMSVAPGNNYIDNYVLAQRHLTGLPLVFKTDEGTFQATSILEGDLGNIVKDGDAYKITLGDPTQTLSYNGEAITVLNVKEAIEQQLGITVASYSDTVIDLDDPDINRWGTLELLNALSNVYVQGFGPYGEITDYSGDDNPDHPNASYYITPNENFTPQEYWNVPNDRKIPIEIKKWNYYGDTSGCDFYILTAWGNTMIGNPAEGETVNLTDSYYAQGDGDDGKTENEYVNITYFDISSFAGTQYPNFLCYLNMVFSSFAPSTIYEGGDISTPKWIGVNTDSTLIGQSPASTSIVFPSNCPYDITNGIEPSVSDITADKWDRTNGFSVECNFTINQTFEEYYIDGSDLAPEDIAISLFEDYAQAFPEKFLSSSSATAKQFPLKLKMRSYPAYASDSIGSTGYWYLNAYDPLNVGGYYPVKKTPTEAAGTRYTTDVNYTMQ